MKTKKGDVIRITNKEVKDERYDIGDEFIVAIVCNDGDVYIDMNGDQPLWLTEDEYEIVK